MGKGDRLQKLKERQRLNYLATEVSDLGVLRPAYVASQREIVLLKRKIQQRDALILVAFMAGVIVGLAVREMLP